MVFIYNFFLILLSIILLPLILVLFVIQPKFRAGFFNKIGFYKYDSKNKTTIFHAVSVGEVNAIKDLLIQYINLHPDEDIIVTTTTLTGQNLAKKVFENKAKAVTYFPFDFFFSILSFFNTYKPEKIIVAETEIWPCFITIAKIKGIKVYTVNGRISPHSFNGYKKLKFFLRSILNKYEKIFMQSSDDANRIIGIGASKEKVEVMGNLKFDILPNLSKEEIKKYENELKTTGYRLFIAASTHKGEDEKVIYTFKKLKDKFEDAKLLLVPRHPQRYDEVSILLNNSGYKWGKRSNNDNFKENDIILLDTMGELAKLFSICYIAFIGGSFSTTGGHNPLEANIWNKPVISGPSIFNFKDVYKILTEKNCAIVVSNEEELSENIISFYSDENKYKKYCANTQAVFKENAGAIKYVLEKI